MIIKVRKIGNSAGIILSKTILEQCAIKDEVKNTIIVASLTSTVRNYPTRVNCFVDGKNGQVALDQLRTVDKIRLSNKIATLDQQTEVQVLETLVEMFS